MPTFELPFAPPLRNFPEPAVPDGLGRRMLLHNARWFTRIRWVISLLFVAVGLAGLLFPDIISRCGFETPRMWPWIMAAILAGSNTLFCLSY